MNDLFKTVGRWVMSMIDFFYPPFSKYVTLQFFRYGVTGVANMIFDWVLYYVTFHFILDKQMLDVGFDVMSSHIASMVLVFPITFLSGFLLQKYVTFHSSENKSAKQIVRYLSVVMANLLLNYAGLKIMVDVLNFFPTPSKMAITMFCTLFSYISQRTYTFGTSKSKP